MALTDISYYDGGFADLIVKTNTVAYSGNLNDIVNKTEFIYGLSLTGGSGATDYAFGG